MNYFALAAATLSGAMKKVSDPAAITGFAIGTDASTPQNYAGASGTEAILSLGVDLTGDLWMRVRAPDEASNSFYWSLDGGKNLVQFNFPPGGYRWFRVASNRKVTTVHNLLLRMREHDCWFDVFAIGPAIETPTDDAARAALAQTQPPTNPPARTWPYTFFGVGIPQDVTDASWSPPDPAALNYDAWYSWWPFPEGNANNRMIPHVTALSAINDAYRAQNDGRPLLLLNEPERSGDGANPMNTNDAAALVKLATDNWQGARIGPNVVLSLDSEDFTLGRWLDSFWTRYGSLYGGVQPPLDYMGVHLYANVLFPYRASDPWRATTVAAADATVGMLQDFIARQRSLGRPHKVVITEGFVLAHPDLYNTYPVYRIAEKFAGLWLDIIPRLRAVPEVVAILPFSLNYRLHKANNHVHDDGELTVLGEIYNHFVNTLDTRSTP